MVPSLGVLAKILASVSKVEIVNPPANTLPFAVPSEDITPCACPWTGVATLPFAVPSEDITP